MQMALTYCYPTDYIIIDAKSLENRSKSFRSLLSEWAYIEK